MARALAKEPGRRYRMIELQEALGDALGDLEGSAAESLRTRASMVRHSPVEPSASPTLSGGAGEVEALLERVSDVARRRGTPTARPARAGGEPDRDPDGGGGRAGVGAGAAIGGGQETAWRGREAHPTAAGDRAGRPTVLAPVVVDARDDGDPRRRWTVPAALALLAVAAVLGWLLLRGPGSGSGAVAGSGATRRGATAPAIAPPSAQPPLGAAAGAAVAPTTTRLPAAAPVETPPEVAGAPSPPTPVPPPGRSSPRAPGRRSRASVTERAHGTQPAPSTATGSPVAPKGGDVDAPMDGIGNTGTDK